MDRKQVEELVEQSRKKRSILAHVQRSSDRQLLVNGHPYDLILDNHSTFNLKAFEYRYNPVYNHFDYILGDWSYGQLRLTGFYGDVRQVPNNLKISYLRDFLMEYCNFGVSYFVLKNVDTAKHKSRYQHRYSGGSHRFGRNHRRRRSFSHHHRRGKRFSARRR